LSRRNRSRTERIHRPWPIRLAILLLAVTLLSLSSPLLRGQLAPQPDAPPRPGAASPAPTQPPVQPLPEIQPAAPPPPQLNSQPSSNAPQPQAARPKQEPVSPQETSRPAPPPSQQGIPTLRVSVNLVDLFFVVHDKSGKLVPNLTRADCDVFEDNAPQKLKSFTAQSDLPLSIGLLLDTSLSQQRVLPDEQQAASAFLARILRPTDSAFLISFDVTVDLLTDWTSNPDNLTKALDAARINSSSGNFANGTLPSITKPKGTLLYDAVYLASNDKLRKESGRKAIVLLTDGQDEGSEEKLESAIESAQKADAVVYVLLISDAGIYSTLSFSSDSAMRKLVEATGGEVFPIGKNGKKLAAAFDTIESQLRTEYQATYTPSNAMLDGSYRHIRVACRQNGQPLKVQARQGYYATAR
jgi:VWFA-related protein